MTTAKKPMPKLDPAAFRAVATPKPDPVAAVAATEVQEAEPPRPTPAPKALRAPRSPSGGGDTAPALPPSREGRVQQVFWTTPQTRHALKRAALDEERTVESVLNELVAGYLRKQGGQK